MFWTPSDAPNSNVMGKARYISLLPIPYWNSHPVPKLIMWGWSIFFFQMPVQRFDPGSLPVIAGALPIRQKYLHNALMHAQIHAKYMHSGYRWTLLAATHGLSLFVTRPHKERGKPPQVPICASKGCFLVITLSFTDRPHARIITPNTEKLSHIILHIDALKIIEWSRHPQ